METIVLTAHIVICVFLVILVLLQSGKEGMGVIFGGGSSSLFGSSGAGGVLAKLTAFVAVGFIVTSLAYNVLTTERAPVTSVMDSVQIEDSVPPAVPVTPEVPGTTAPATSDASDAPGATATPEETTTAPAAPAEATTADAPAATTPEEAARP